MQISLHIEEDQPGGFCSLCGELIIGKGYTPMSQIGEPENAEPLEVKFCETCYNQIFKED